MIRKCTVFLFWVCTVLLVAELALRTIEYLETRKRIVLERDIVPDNSLGRRMRSYAAGHDAKGFRNATVPKRSKAVVIGDSQTWGVNVSREKAYPRKLGRLLNQSVYQMSMGGYGSVHYRVLLDKALMLRPRVIVVGLYFGNDLWDAYRMVYTTENYGDLRLRPTPECLLEDSIEPRAKRLWNMEKSFLGDMAFAIRCNIISGYGDTRLSVGC